MISSLQTSRFREHQVFQSFHKYWYLIALTFLFSLLAALFEGLGIGLLIPFLRSMSGATADVFQTNIGWIDNWMLAVEAPQLERLYRISGLILVATLLRCAFSYHSGYFALMCRVKAVEDLRMRLIDQLQAVSLRFYTKTRGGELINTLTNELSRVSRAMGVVTTVVSHSFLLLVYASFIIYVSWQLSALVLGFFFLLWILLSRLIRLIRQSGRRVTEANGDFTSAAAELLNGIRTVVAFNMQAFERARLQDRTNELAQANIQTGKRALLVQPLTQAVVGSVLIFVILLAVQLFVLPGKLDMALLLAFLFALMRLMPTMHVLNSQRGQWAGYRAALNNVEDLLREEDKPYLQDGAEPAGPLREAVMFDHVTFCYDPEEPVLKDINLRFEHGKTTAVVGASGAGKTTLVDLIPRFYDPSDGRILLDGLDIRSFTLASLRQKVALVSQDTHIFNDSVRANIAYGVPEATLEQVTDAAKKANALEFILELAEGFNTVLGDRGVRLSGGQRQRLAIARALLRDPEILILDEATSALDSVSERLVQQSLENLMLGRTVIAIAHRLSTVENADHVVVLENGEVVEQGSYSELIARKGQLWKYHRIQFQAA